MVMNCSTFLLLSELSEVWISLLQLSNTPQIVFSLLHLSLAITLVNKSALSSLAHLDIAQVTVAKKCEHAQQSEEISITIVVDIVWLVPVWESTDVLMGDWGFVTRLEVSRDPISNEQS